MMTKVPLTAGVRSLEWDRRLAAETEKTQSTNKANITRRVKSAARIVRRFLLFRVQPYQSPYCNLLGQ